MLTIISPAKLMNTNIVEDNIFTSTPLFESYAKEIAEIACGYAKEDIAKMLKISSEQAIINYDRYRDFIYSSEGKKPAILQYDGIVYKHLLRSPFSNEDLLYAQDHLRITSFMYGLLRPLDTIKPYRMEGGVKFAELDNKTIFDFWSDKITNPLLEDIKREGGVLINLASSEMKRLFQWKRIEKEIEVITPEFKIYKNGALKNIVVYTKMARGEMTKYIIKNRITDKAKLKEFEWEGFFYDEELSTENSLMFTNKNF